MATLTSAVNNSSNLFVGCSYDFSANTFYRKDSKLETIITYSRIIFNYNLLAFNERLNGDCPRLMIAVLNLTMKHPFSMIIVVKGVSGTA